MKTKTKRTAPAATGNGPATQNTKKVTVPSVTETGGEKKWN